MKYYHAPKHDLETISNCQVIKAMQSLKSRGYMKEPFARRHFYWYLTNDGIEYLRGYLDLPPEIVPSGWKPAAHLDLAVSGHGCLFRDNREPRPRGQGSLPARTAKAPGLRKIALNTNANLVALRLQWTRRPRLDR